MTRLAPLDRADLPDLEDHLALAEASMGFLPNSLLIMARRPELVKSFVGFMAQVNLGGALSPGLRQMIAYMTQRLM